MTFQIYLFSNKHIFYIYILMILFIIVKNLLLISLYKNTIFILILHIIHIINKYYEYIYNC